MSLRPGGSGGIQSLERAFAILEEIARNRDGIGLAELSKRVGLHNSTTFHLAKTMLGLGYIEQLEDSRRYRIGRHLFTLAAGALDDVRLVALATPALERPTRATGEASHFAVRSGDKVVVLARTSGSGTFQMAVPVGIERPAHATALGKVLLAALSLDELERYLESHELRPYTPRTIVEQKRLKRSLAEVRRNAIAFDDGEFDAEVRCVAVPVYDFAARVAGAIGISGPVWRLSLEALEQHAASVKAVAEELSRALGFAPGPLAARRGPRGND